MTILRAVYRLIFAFLHRDQADQIEEVLSVVEERAAAADGALGAARVWARELLDLVRSGSLVGAGAGGLDLRMAARGLRRAPLFSTIAVVTLGVAVGGAGAVGHVWSGFLTATLPYPGAERVVRLDARNAARGQSGETFRVTEWEAFSESGSLEAVVGAFPLESTLEAEEPRRVSGLMVTPGFFEFFGADFDFGRGFSPTDDPDLPRVVLSSAAAESWLGTTGSPVDRSIELDGTRYAVAGVLASGFEPPVAGDFYLHAGRGTEGWTGRWLTLFGRLTPSAQLESTRAEVTAIMAGLEEEAGRSPDWDAEVTPLQASMLAAVMPTLRLLVITVLMLLGIALANVAALLLTRTLQRRSDMVLRVALGSPVARGGRLPLFEALILSGLAALLACGVAWTALTALAATAPVALPFRAALEPTPGLLLVMAGLCAGAGVLAALPGIALGRRLGRVRGSGVVRARGPEPRLLAPLLVAQAALALIGTGMTGLILRSVDRLLEQDVGFVAEGAGLWEVSLATDRFPDATSLNDALVRLSDELNRPDAITRAGLGSNGPLSGAGAWGRIYDASRTGDVSNGIPTLQRSADPGYFAALGTRLVEGRTFGPQDGPDSEQVVVLSATLARTLWPNGSAVGQEVTFRSRPEDEDWWRVVGVVADVRFEGMTEVGRPQYFRPLAQEPQHTVALIARGDDLAAVRAAVRSVVTEVDPRAPLTDHGAVSDLVAGDLAPFTFAARTLSGFALLGLLLVFSGVYGTAALMVAGRRRESGIRLALGAEPASVVRGVVGRTLRWTLLGIPLGIGGAWLAREVLAGFLPMGGTMDPVAWMLAVGLLLLLGILAALLPALDASRTDPALVLRSE